MTKKYMIGLIWLLILSTPASISFAQEKESNKSKYEKLFKDKKSTHAHSNFISLHKVDNKVYFEVPLDLLGKEMIMGATISSVSDATYLTVGQTNSEPIHFRFEVDNEMVLMKKPNNIVLDDGKFGNRKQAIAINYTDPTIMGFKVLTYNPDSTAVLFDASSLVAKPNSRLNLIPSKNGEYSLSASPKSEMSYVKSIKSFDSNISIRTELNYDLTVSIMGIVPIISGLPTTIEATFSVIKLPEERMMPRFVDARVGYQSSNKYQFVEDNAPIKKVKIAHRWRLEPKDPSQYDIDGVPTLPKEPIVFYLDTLFPADWKAPIREGVLRWNKAFEAAGFKDAIVVKDFPKDDPYFDADNIAYSTIRYIPNMTENATGPVWVDPISGEILNASIFIYNNIEQLLYRWRFVQTSNVDSRMQSDRMPAELLHESLAYVVAHETGHTLGLLHNAGASASYPTDSLRSATFTQKYGTTPSIMDYARFNYIAQPQDTGVCLTPPNIGSYDYHAIKWGYCYLPLYAGNIQKEADALEAYVDNAIKDPMLRFKPVQDFGFVIDPTAVIEDLGDDPIKSSEYGMKNLGATLKNLSKWIKNDEDSKKKNALNLAIAQQYHAYIKHVMHLVGGIEVNATKENSTIPRYRIIPKERQREAFLWVIENAKRFPTFADRDLEKSGFLGVSYFDQLLEFLSMNLFRIRTRVMIAEHIDPKSYTQKEYFTDLYQALFENTIRGKGLSTTEMYLQKAFVENGQAYVTGNAPASGPSMPMAFQVAPDHFSLPATGIYPSINPSALDKGAIYYFDALHKLRPLLVRASKNAKSVDERAHYQLLLHRIGLALDKK